MTPYLTQLIDANPNATPAELVALAAQQPRTTAAPIPLASLAPLLRKTGIMAVLKAVAADPAANATLRAGVQAFLDQLTDLRQTTLGTDEPDIATQTAGVLAALAPIVTGAGIDAAATTGAIYALGGGLRYPAIVEQEVSDYRAARDRQAALDVLDNDWGTKVYGVGRAELQRRVAAGEPLPTLAELVTFVQGTLS